MRNRMIVAGGLAILMAAIPSAGQEAKPTDPSRAPVQATVSPEQARLKKSTEAFVRQLFGWGPNIKVTLGEFGPSAAGDFYTVPIEVTVGDQKETGEVYVSKDGKTLLRGDIYDMSADPFAANRAKIHVDGSPSKGPAGASVTVVEFADFECPHALSAGARGIQGLSAHANSSLGGYCGARGALRVRAVACGILEGARRDIRKSGPDLP